MSGTSLDGLDLAYCHFRLEGNQWSYKILATRSVSYNLAWQKVLKDAINGSKDDISRLDINYGKWLGTATRQFIDDKDLEVDLIASHGHTIFHEPAKGITLQIGSGAEIANITGIKVVCDFRKEDVALGGQGAPLVPIGDELLFGYYALCLNLGGIANISYKVNDERIAFDIGMANMPLNYLSEQLGQSFDKDGKKTSEGEFITHLSSDSKCMAYEFVSGDMAEPDLGLIIIDAKNGATIILSEDKGKKTGLVYGLGTFSETVQTESLEDLDLSETPETYLANPNVEKTGRTKTIAGFKCDEYKYNDDYSTSNIWITKDIKMNTKDFFSTLFKTSLYSHGMGWGYMMEATTVNKENEEKSVMTVTQVDKNSNTKVSMSDYQVTNLGSFAAFAEK